MTTRSRFSVFLVYSRITSNRKEPSMLAFEGARFIENEYTINATRCQVGVDS